MAKLLISFNDLVTVVDGMTNNQAKPATETEKSDFVLAFSDGPARGTAFISLLNAAGVEKKKIQLKLSQDAFNLATVLKLTPNNSPANNAPNNTQLIDWNVDPTEFITGTIKLELHGKMSQTALRGYDTTSGVQQPDYTESFESGGTAVTTIPFRVLSTSSAPSALSYPALDAVLLQYPGPTNEIQLYALPGGLAGIPLPTLPQVTGVPTSYSVSPALPGTLLFNTTTGAISSSANPPVLPNLDNVTHTFTATNAGGSTQKEYVLHSFDINNLPNPEPEPV